MAINRRRAASSEISSDKKKSGHKYEEVFAQLIDGEVIKGTQKGDVRDQHDFQYSVKSGKKWQIFLYGHERIVNSQYLKILQASLEAFPADSEIYFRDRTRCIEFKEAYVKKHGREAARFLMNEEVSKAIGDNEYVNSKSKLAEASEKVSELLKDKVFLRKFLSEALFNNEEVSYLAIRDSTYLQDNIYRTFDREDVLDIFSKMLVPASSKAGNVPEDFNVPGQKTLLRYNLKGNVDKNIVEIEIRNDSNTHYRQVRFNMYSKDALILLTDGLKDLPSVSPRKGLQFYGRASNLF
jgi:hypothetical protein